MDNPEVESALRAARENQNRYKNVFGTAEGKRVLGDILLMGHFGFIDPPEDAVKVAEYNFAMTIARLAGAFDTLYNDLRMTGE